MATADGGLGNGNGLGGAYFAMLLGLAAVTLAWLARSRSGSHWSHRDSRAVRVGCGAGGIRTRGQVGAGPPGSRQST
ncbi:DUF6223 family protein [Streptomyces sp. NPDC012510]|uniref:DUF6223 family protein n=1 Tax=Streptomyces sp. NPDC012510 TaxID=3364838 RepID=UPI0036EB4C89